jgi:hypothetical protein
MACEMRQPVASGGQSARLTTPPEELQAESDIAAYLSDNLKAALQLFVQRVRG